MAYDLIFRRQIDKDISRDHILKSPQSIVAGLLGIAVLAKVVIIPRIIRARERNQYRVEYASGSDYTREIPNLPMSELVAKPWSPREDGR